MKEEREKLDDWVHNILLRAVHTDVLKVDQIVFIIIEKLLPKPAESRLRT